MEAAAREVAAGAKPENKAATVSLDRFKTARTDAGAAAADAAKLRVAMVAGADALADLATLGFDVTTDHLGSALGRLDKSQNRLEKCCFACAIWADKSCFFASQKRCRGFDKQKLVAILLADVFDTDHVFATPLFGDGS